MQLTSGKILTAGFPNYDLNSEYQHPLNAEGQALEKLAVSHVGHNTTMEYLEKLVNDAPTRSFSDKVDSEHI